MFQKLVFQSRLETKLIENYYRAAEVRDKNGLIITERIVVSLNTSRLSEDLSGVAPFERLCHRLVEIGHEIQNPIIEVINGSEACPA